MILHVLLPKSSFEASAQELLKDDLRHNMLVVAKLLRLLTSEVRGRWSSLISQNDYSEPLAMWSSYPVALAYYGCLMGKRYHELTGNPRPVEAFKHAFYEIVHRFPRASGLPGWRFWEPRLRASQATLYYNADYRAFRKACVNAHKRLLHSNTRIHRRGQPYVKPAATASEFCMLQGWNFSRDEFYDYAGTVWHALEGSYRQPHPTNPYRSLGYVRNNMQMPHVGRFSRHLIQ